MRFLAVDLGLDRTSLLLTTARGGSLRSARLPAAGPAGPDSTTLDVMTGWLQDPEEVTGVVALPGDELGNPDALEAVGWLRHHWPGLAWLAPSRVQAELAGGLGGRPGLLVYAGLRTVAAGLDRTGRTTLASDALPYHEEEGSLPWLAYQGLSLACSGEGRLLRRLEEAHGPGAGPRLRNELRQGRLQWRQLQQVAALTLELAEYPGPDPGCRAQVLKAARRLAELTRRAAARSRWQEGPSATWGGPALAGPLREAFLNEVYRYLPQLRWKPPRYDACGGCLLLALAALRVGRHRPRGQSSDSSSGRGESGRACEEGPQLLPGLASIPLPAGMHPVDQEVWRELLRLKDPLPDWQI